VRCRHTANQPIEGRDDRRRTRHNPLFQRRSRIQRISGRRRNSQVVLANAVLAIPTVMAIASQGANRRPGSGSHARSPRMRGGSVAHLIQRATARLARHGGSRAPALAAQECFTSFKHAPHTAESRHRCCEEMRPLIPISGKSPVNGRSATVARAAQRISWRHYYGGGESRRAAVESRRRWVARARSTSGSDGSALRTVVPPSTSRRIHIVDTSA
jgi:hypothetical protein